MIIYICKFLHLISLFIAGGGGIGSTVIQSIYKKEGKVLSLIHISEPTRLV